MSFDAGKAVQLTTSQTQPSLHTRTADYNAETAGNRRFARENLRITMGAQQPSGHVLTIDAKEKQLLRMSTKE